MKAFFSLEAAIDRGLQFVAFIPVIVWILYPSLARAEFSPQQLGKTAQVFEVKVEQPDTTKSIVLENQDQTVGVSIDINSEIEHQTKLIYKNKLYIFLSERNSPFAECVDIIVDLPNADKILSLANAESGLGKRAPRGLHNYWGIGGSKLWKMGNNVCEGIVSMDDFLTNYPRRSAVKYSQMSIEKMNGLYKQPARQHWVTNNKVILNKLAVLKDQSKQEATTIVNNRTAQHLADK